MATELDDASLLRYARHILLDEIGIEGQQALQRSTVLVIGAGGLGSATLLYLASSGVGRVVVMDHDTVDITNLQRQICHQETSLGQPKVLSAQNAMRAINSHITIEALNHRADAIQLAQWLPKVDVVVDCTDNFLTRHVINRACWEHQKPLVSGAGIRMDGQLSVFDFRQSTSPCYACLHPPHPHPDEVSCASMGVFAPLVGIIGTMQAAETLKLLVGLPSHAVGRLLLFDARNLSIETMQFGKRMGCEVCG